MHKKLTTEEILAPIRKVIEKRFLSKVTKTEGCWRWVASIDPSTGYGQMLLTSGDVKRKERTHRLAWLLFCGSIPEGARVCHTCDSRACVNPSHLFLGTARDNTIDMCRKGRLGANHIDFKTAVAIREIYKTGNTSQPKLAAQFGISQSSINRLLLNQTWKAEVHA